MLIKKKELLEKKSSKFLQKRILHSQTNGLKNSKDFSKRSLLRTRNSNRPPQIMNNSKRIVKRIQHHQHSQVILKSRLLFLLKRMSFSKSRRTLMKNSNLLPLKTEKLKMSEISSINIQFYC